MHFYIRDEALGAYLIRSYYESYTAIGYIVSILKVKFKSSTPYRLDRILFSTYIR